jgi:hypothetical protein
VWLSLGDPTPLNRSPRNDVLFVRLLWTGRYLRLGNMKLARLGRALVVVQGLFAVAFAALLVRTFV